MADNIASASVTAANTAVPIAQHNKLVSELKADLAWLQSDLSKAEVTISGMWKNHEVVFVAVVSAVVGAVIWAFI